jgi:predicted DNA-binding transcriptional regulator AlpA
MQTLFSGLIKALLSWHLAKPSPVTMVKGGLLTASELSQLLNISTRSVFRLKSAGQLPPSVKINKVARWRASDIQEWISKKRGA